MASVELAGVSKLYGTTRAVDDVSLKIPDGSYCCLLGPSGCGKTSTLRMIAGHEAISQGDVMIGDRIVNDLPPVQRGTAMMFQSYALFPHLSCVDNVAFSLHMRGVEKSERRQQARADARARAHGAVCRAAAGAAVGRAAAAGRPGASADHQPEGPAPGRVGLRAAVRMGLCPTQPDRTAWCRHGI